MTERWAIATESGWSKDSAAASVRAGPALDDSSDSFFPALEALDSLVTLAPDSPDRLESGRGTFEGSASWDLVQWNDLSLSVRIL